MLSHKNITAENNTNCTSPQSHSSQIIPISPIATPNSISIKNLLNSNDDIIPSNIQTNNSTIHNQPFMQRMSNIPLIHTLGNAYEATKNVSRVVKYSAESVESGVISIATPVFNTLEPALAPLDRFACSQLDILERSFTYLKGSSSSQINYGAINNPEITDNSSSNIKNPIESQIHLESTKDSASQLPLPNNAQNTCKKWSQLVPGVSSLKLISEDMVRGLKYCIQWLQYAAGHIDAQMTILTHYLSSIGVSMANTASTLVNSRSISIPANEELQTLLGNIKRQVAETLRKVIEIVGEYASICLPGEARNSVRGFILSLPSRMASINSRFKSQSENIFRETTEKDVFNEAQKVMTLGTESSNMVKGIESVFVGTVDGLGIEMDMNVKMDVETGNANDEIEKKQQVKMDACEIEME